MTRKFSNTYEKQYKDLLRDFKDYTRPHVMRKDRTDLFPHNEDLSVDLTEYRESDSERKRAEDLTRLIRLVSDVGE